MSVFHRKTNPATQTFRTAVLQTRSRELWGRGAFGGLPAALSYIGPLAQEEGTEFACAVPYASNGHPAWAYWYLPADGGDAGVTERIQETESFASVPIDPLINRYGCR